MLRSRQLVTATTYILWKAICSGNYATLEITEDWGVKKSLHNVSVY